MKSTSLILSCVAVILLGANAATAQVKLGIVDVEKIVQQLPEFKGIEAKLRGLRQSYEDTLRAIQASFQTRLENYQKQQSLMTAEARQKEEADLNQIRDQFLSYQQERLGSTGSLAQVQDSLVAPVRERVRTAIERVARDEKLSAVIDKGYLVYAEPKLDITFKVLDYLNRGTN